MHPIIVGELPLDHHAVLASASQRVSGPHRAGALPATIFSSCRSRRIQQGFVHACPPVHSEVVVPHAQWLLRIRIFRCSGSWTFSDVGKVRERLLGRVDSPGPKK